MMTTDDLSPPIDTIEDPPLHTFENNMTEMTNGEADEASHSPPADADDIGDEEQNTSAQEDDEHPDTEGIVNKSTDDVTIEDPTNGLEEEEEESEEVNDYTCTVCSSVFDNCTDFQAHIVGHLTDIDPTRVHLPSPPPTDDTDNDVISPVKVEMEDAAMAAYDAGQALVTPSARHNPGTNGGIHICPSCPEKFDALDNLVEHINTAHAPERKFSCCLCGRCFAKKKALRVHMVSWHMGKAPYTCPVCDKRYKSGKPFRDHLSQHKELSKEEVQRALIPHTVDPTLDVSRDDTASTETPHSCPHCPSGPNAAHFANRSDLLEHMLSRHTGRAFTCSLCGRDCPTKVGLRNHLMGHMSQKSTPIRVCPVCDKVYKSWKPFQDHLILQHNLTSDAALQWQKEKQAQDIRNMKGLDGAECDPLSPPQRSPKRARVSHPGIKPDLPLPTKAPKELATPPLVLPSPDQLPEGEFRCPLCPMTYASRVDLNHHSMTLHADPSQLICATCGERCSSTEKMHQHFLTHIRLKPHACPVCERVLDTWYNLQRHLTCLHSHFLGNGGSENTGTSRRHHSTSLASSVAGGGDSGRPGAMDSSGVNASSRLSMGERGFGGKDIGDDMDTVHRANYQNQRHSTVHHQPYSGPTPPRAHQQSPAVPSVPSYRPVARSITHTCSFCLKVFRTRIAYTEHLATHSSDSTLNQNASHDHNNAYSLVTNRSSSGGVSASRHWPPTLPNNEPDLSGIVGRPKGSGKAQHHCLQCSRSFSTADELRNHEIKDHGDQTVFKCSVCAWWCHRMDQFVAHLEGHRAAKESGH